MSRIAQLKEDYGERYEPEMPIADAKYLLDYLWEVGPVMAAGMGSGPVTFQELCAWQSLCGIALEPWENKFLRMLSMEYLIETHKAEKRDAPAPWVRVTQDQRDLVSDKIRSIMSGRAAPKRKGRF